MKGLFVSLLSFFRTFLLALPPLALGWLAFYPTSLAHSLMFLVRIHINRYQTHSFKKKTPGSFQISLVQCLSPHFLKRSEVATLSDTIQMSLSLRTRRYVRSTVLKCVHLGYANKVARARI
ncbi:hypothetical protein C8Q69DRAFT_481535 [Paecilomyces variotii]|uniref:Uncharacterized protein n=1 Tax=Byssochlamys spectabilis TaxID=264951 RepID=A0A443HIQ3_BYSSP|nr:hypothetical protein C8Q69DRAFT_481535 [Paecilomyces variotii]RWQ91720.1 hypothetical protein C8Q69DRAFT_481535 [Paecilomyces variotii]